MWKNWFVIFVFITQPLFAKINDAKTTNSMFFEIGLGFIPWGVIPNWVDDVNHLDSDKGDTPNLAFYASMGSMNFEIDKSIGFGAEFDYSYLSSETISYNYDLGELNSSTTEHHFALIGTFSKVSGIYNKTRYGWKFGAGLDYTYSKLNFWGNGYDAIQPYANPLNLKPEGGGFGFAGILAIYLGFLEMKLFINPNQNAYVGFGFMFGDNAKDVK